MKILKETKNIYYVEVTVDLICDYLEMVNDYENVGRYIGLRTNPFSYEEELNFIKSKQLNKAQLFSMVEKETGDFIGNIELMDINNGEAEMGIALTYSKQNKHYGREAINMIIEYGFKELQLKRIYLKAFKTNHRAHYVYNLCGFKQYKEEDQHIYMEIFN